MDPRRGGIDRSASVYGGVAALRGVKIDVKRGCLDEIRLPESVKNAPSFNPRDYAYNFEREKDVIRRAEDRRRSSLAAIADQPDSDVPATGKPVSAANPVSASSLLHGILQPTVLTGTATAASGKSDDARKAIQQKINYAEFEDQSSTPFEDVALQTIDDMGELRQILQPAGAAVETEESSSTDGRCNVKQPPKPKPRVRSTPNALPVPKPRPRPDNSPKVTRLPPGAKPTAFAAAAAAAAKAAPSQEQPPSYDSLAPQDPSQQQQQADSFNVGGDDLLPPPYEVDASSAPTQPRPAPRQNNFVSRGPEGLVLPNPYSKLKADQRAFVDRTATMGFPQERVARIVQKVGTEEKDVFDALLLIGKIEDKYPANSAEVALFNNKLNLEKSLESLKVAFELKELGFPEEKIHEALKRHENDREKALDFLLSSA
ncbi:ubiquitin-associated protein 1-like isoform X2 [Oscarella lobularis]|uniref:ubiquitin-associated protein 1-like isoform X2 n=1 Tax=Oscarella lobularis TaxID=121494 RepID=UPI0033134061